MVISCCVRKCRKRFSKSEKGWARLPKKTEKRGLWLSSINRKEWNPNYDNDRVCPAHFVTGICYMLNKVDRINQKICCFEYDFNNSLIIAHLTMIQEHFAVIIAVRVSSRQLFYIKTLFFNKGAPNPDPEHPDFVPSINMGHHSLRSIFIEKGIKRKARYDRAERRAKMKKDHNELLQAKAKENKELLEAANVLASMSATIRGRLDCYN